MQKPSSSHCEESTRTCPRGQESFLQFHNWSLSSDLCWTDPTFSKKYVKTPQTQTVSLSYSCQKFHVYNGSKLMRMCIGWRMSQTADLFVYKIWDISTVWHHTFYIFVSLSLGAYISFSYKAHLVIATCTCGTQFTCVTKMAASTSPLLMRILAASVSVSNRAATIIRDIMQKGELGIVEKVGIINSSF